MLSSPTDPPRLHRCWRGLFVCGCGVGLQVKIALASLMATCAAKGGEVVSPPLGTWMGDRQRGLLVSTEWPSGAERWHEEVWGRAASIGPPVTTYFRVRS